MFLRQRHRLPWTQVEKVDLACHVAALSCTNRVAERQGEGNSLLGILTELGHALRWRWSEFGNRSNSALEASASSAIISSLSVLLACGALVAMSHSSHSGTHHLEFSCSSPSEIRRAIRNLRSEELVRQSAACNRTELSWKDILLESGGKPFRGAELMYTFRFSFKEHFETSRLSRHPQCQSMTIRCWIHAQTNFLLPDIIVSIENHPERPYAVISKQLATGP